MTAECGQSACGSDYVTYSCSAAGWTWTGASCSGNGGASGAGGSGGTCQCTGTGPGNVSVTVDCGASACGSDYVTYSCDASGWSWTGQACSGNGDAGVPPCQCTGTGPGGVPVTANCGQAACGSDYITYSCDASGWSWTGQACSGNGDAGVECHCSGTGPDGVPVTVACGESACGSDYITYSCSASAWSWTGASCSGNGGATGTGGSTVVGGAGGTGGTLGTGGTTAACQAGETKCSADATGLHTCADGQWGLAVVCGPHQTCSVPAGTAECSCNVDPICTSVGDTCSGASLLVSCARDAQACLYQSSATTCDDGACFGPVGSASCCTNACTAGTTCLSGTTLATCVVGANGCTVAATSTCASGLVCERYPPAACLDPAWAEWPMPNGQADVTAGAANLASYTLNGDGTVADNVTGLMWQQAASLGPYTWEEAKAYCATLTLADYTDWRLPSRIELVSLLDFGRSQPAIDTLYFPTAVTGKPFWSSSPRAGSSSEAWAVRFQDGLTGYGATSNTSHVRCVR